MAKVELSLLLMAAICCLTVGPASAVTHIVGGSLGWTIPPNKTFYEDWAKPPRVFGIKDKLLFPFRGMHNVVEVSRKDFNKCTQKKRLNLYPFGPVIMNLTEPGDYYFFSGVGIQCEKGQKFHIVVVPGEGTTGRIQSTLRVGIVAPAPAPAPSKSSAAGPISSWGMVAGFISLVAWLFV